MNYKLIQDVVELAAQFESENSDHLYSNDISGFKNWIADRTDREQLKTSPPHWEGKETGRSQESIINTLFVHLNRYARNYAKAAISESQFSTPEEFIYLINLNVNGAMSKTQLIRKNVQDKSFGMQIINRLIREGWVLQTDSESDKRSKLIAISKNGKDELEKHMGKIRLASKIVTGDLDEHERLTLIGLLTKLDAFHRPIFEKDFPNKKLLENAAAYGK